MTDKEKRTTDGRKDCSFCPFLSYTGICKKYEIDSDEAKHKCDKQRDRKLKPIRFGSFGQLICCRY